MIKVFINNEVDSKGEMRTYLSFALPGGLEKLEVNRESVRFSDLKESCVLLIDCLSSFGAESFEPIAKKMGIQIDWHFMAGPHTTLNDYHSREKYLNKWFDFN